MIFTYTCAGYDGNDCGTEFDVNVIPVAPARRGNRMEDAFPAEDDEYEPGACPECGTEVDYDWVQQKANEIKEGPDDE